VSATTAVQRKRLTVRGVVQGVGFRPFVSRLATAHELTGYVLNTGVGVEVEVEGGARAVAEFERALVLDAPQLARIDDLSSQVVAVRGDSAFAILPSRGARGATALVPPDIATCDQCLQELFDPAAQEFFRGKPGLFGADP